MEEEEAQEVLAHRRRSGHVDRQWWRPREWSRNVEGLRKVNYRRTRWYTETRNAYGHRPRQGVGMEMPWNSVMALMAQPGAMTVPGVTRPLDTMVVVMGLEMCSTQHAMGPLPVACACTMKPVNASCNPDPFPATLESVSVYERSE
jgi:hypothetical protein